jgi:hypothetical protein
MAYVRVRRERMIDHFFMRRADGSSSQTDAGTAGDVRKAPRFGRGSGFGSQVSCWLGRRASTG